MASSDILRIVDTLSREKNINKEMVWEDLEEAIASAVRKRYGAEADVTVAIDRTNGTLSASKDGQIIEPRTLGRIAAQNAKQFMMQKIREAERGSIFDEYSKRVGEIVTGTMSRFEGGAVLVNLGRTEGFLPRSEQIPGETHHPGERVRGMILDVRESPHQVRIVLTRSHPDYIRRLFELEVPEVAERIIEIKALAREAGYRTKIAVSSIDSRVDAVGACVGVRGSRIRNIVDELGGEKIDIVRWNESSQILIGNALKPAEVQETALCFELGRATVVVAEDQLSLAIGKRGQNVRLAARLTGWDVEILTPAEYNKGLDRMEKSLSTVEGVDDVLLDRLVAMGLISVQDIEEVGAEPLVNELELDATTAESLVARACAAAKEYAAEDERAKAEKLAREAAEREAAAAAGAEAAETDEAVTGDQTGPPLDGDVLDGDVLDGDVLDGAALDDAASDAAALDDAPLDDAASDDAPQVAPADDEVESLQGESSSSLTGAPADSQPSEDEALMDDGVDAAEQMPPRNAAEEAV